MINAAYIATLAGPAKGMEAHLGTYYVRPVNFDLIFTVNPRENQQTSAGNSFFYTLPVPFAPFQTLEKAEMQSNAGYGTLVLMTDVESEILKHISRLERFLRLKSS